MKIEFHDEYFDTVRNSHYTNFIVYNYNGCDLALDSIETFALAIDLNSNTNQLISFYKFSKAMQKELKYEPDITLGQYDKERFLALKYEPLYDLKQFYYWKSSYRARVVKVE